MRLRGNRMHIDVSDSNAHARQGGNGHPWLSGAVRAPALHGMRLARKPDAIVEHQEHHRSTICRVESVAAHARKSRRQVCLRSAECSAFPFAAGACWRPSSPKILSLWHHPEPAAGGTWVIVLKSNAAL